MARDRRSEVWCISASILLAFIFALLVAPFAMGDEAVGTPLPACCRAHGAHHCSMGLTVSGVVTQDDEGSTFKTVSAKCPYDLTAPVATHTDTFRPDLQELLFAKVLAYFAGPVQAEARLTIAFDRTRQQRGPPAQFLSA